MWGYSRDLLYQEFLKQEKIDSSVEPPSILGKRLNIPIDDDDCDFRKRVCMGL
jgi:hypothetical protein